MGSPSRQHPRPRKEALSAYWLWGAAGVSVPTVELVFGTEAQLLRAAISFAIEVTRTRTQCCNATGRGERRRRAETAGWIVEGLMKRSSMRTDITRAQAIDTVWLLMDPHGFCVLTRDRGWAPEQFERWFTDSVSRLLLAATDTKAVDRPRSPTSATSTGNSEKRTS